MTLDSLSAVTDQETEHHFRPPPAPLVRNGHIDRRALERLAASALNASAEQAAAARALHGRDLREIARDLLESDTPYRLIRGATRRPERLLDALRQCPVPAELAARLGALSTHQPAQLRHCVGVALIAGCLADRLRLGDDGVARFVTAGVYHDLGETFMPAELLDPAHRLSEGERRHLRAHPLTGYAVLQQFPETRGDVAEAVLQHHERLDGSGYPRGIKADQISNSGRALALAETVERFFEQPLRPDTRSRLGALIKLNAQRFDPALTDTLYQVVRGGDGDVPATDANAPSSAERLASVERLFRAWRNLPPAQAEFADQHRFLKVRMEALARTLIDAGYDPQNPAELTEAVRAEPALDPDVRALTGEALWQLGDIARALGRHCEGRTLDPALTAWTSQALAAN